MPVTYDGIISTEEMFLRLDSTAKQRVKRTLVQKAYEIRDLAIKMAPVDEGDLEKAIKVRGDEAGARDDLGRFTRVEVEVYIDMEAAVTDRPDKTVGDYAYVIHEHLAPYGPMNLGKKSQDKQGRQPEIVGGGFMDRAVVAVDKKIDAALLDMMRDFV